MNAPNHVDQGGYGLGAFYAFVRQRQEPEAAQQVVDTVPEYINSMGAYTSQTLSAILQAVQKGQTFHPPNPVGFSRVAWSILDCARRTI
jgi:predicted amino acid dehydrogenase